MFRSQIPTVRALAFLFFHAFLVAMSTFGQQQPAPAQGKASLNGTLTDQTGALIPNANLVVSNAAGFKQETTSNEKGEYNLTGLDAGVYTLTITVAGFTPKTLDYITLTAGQALTLDTSLDVAGEATKVNVEGSRAGQVEVETATVSGTIDQKQLTTLGLNGRNFTQLIALAPGVSNQTGQDEGKVGVVGSVKYSVNGGRVEYNTFEIDGSDVLNTGLNGSASTLMVYPSLDAIQEVKVLTSNYSAQYGRTASGTVLVTTKSGGPQYHGNLYDFVRNEYFNARNFFDVTPKAPLYRRQDFGGTLGGPLTIPGLYNRKKDKTFFFFSEEVRLEKTPTDYNQAVPSLKERGLIMTPQGIQKNFITDTSGRVFQSFDFTDVCPPAGGGFSRQQYPDCPASGILNGVPQTFLGGGVPDVLPDDGSGTVNKNVLAILNSNLIPLPNSSIGCNYNLPGFNSASGIGKLDPTDPNHCYDLAVSPSTYWREELFRIDHNFTQNNKLSFRYIHDAWDTTVLTPQWGYVRNTFPTVENRFVGPGTSLVARVTNIFSPTLLNDLVLSYVNSNITLTNQNGPGGAQFQRNPILDQPLVTDPANPGKCNPILSSDPLSGFPQCPIGYLFNNGFGGKVPGVQFLGTNAAYGGRGFTVDPSYMPWTHTNPTYSVRDGVSKSIGNHTLTVGGQYVYSQRNQTNNAIGAASGDLQGLLTYSNLANSTGNAFADFLIEQNAGLGASRPVGYIQSFTQDSAQERYYQRYQIAEPYVQDDWKMTPRLTLNLGLRISLFGTFSEKNHNAWNWVPSQFNASRFAVDPNLGVLLDKQTKAPIPFNPSTFQLDPGVVKDLGLVQCGINGTPSGCMAGHLFNPAPRIGFAWDPTGSGKTSVRAGYGIFFEHGTANEANTGSLEASSPVVLSVTQLNPANYACIGNIGFGGGNNSVCGASGQTTAPNSVFPLNITSIPTKTVWPYAQQWSFDVQRELAENLTADVAYVGSKGTNLTAALQLNQARPLPASENPFGPEEPLLVSECTAAGINGANPGVFVLQNGTTVTRQNPAYVYLEAACVGTPGLPNVNSLSDRPYPGLGQIYSLQNIADSSYHALQLRVQHTRGPLTGALIYSYSHAIDDSSDRSDPVLNSYDLRSNRASSNFDERHSLTLDYIYAVPAAHLKNTLGWWLHGFWVSPPCNAPDPNDCPARPRNESLGSGFWDRMIFDGWEISGVTLFQSGIPFTVVNSAGNTGVSLTDNAGVSTGLPIQSYPDVMQGTFSPANNAQSFGPLLGNPSQFVAPRGLTFGDAGRNSMNNPSRFNTDLALLKHIRVRERGEIEFRAETFNLFNQTQFRIYDVDNPGSTGNNVISCYAGPNYSAGFQAAGGADCVTGASFLHPLNAHRPRTMQFGLKMSF